MNALLISEYGVLNGGEFSFITALPVLQAAGIKFTAALPTHSGFAELLAKDGVRIEPFTFHEDDGRRKPQHQIRDDIGELIKRLAPDIVHANSLAAGRILGPITAELKTVGLGYVRDIIKLSRKAIEDVSQLDRIVAVSQATANFHISNGIPSEKVTVIHNGVDLERFHPAWLEPHEHRSPSEKQICLCIGQIGMRKGIDMTLHMLSRAFKKLPYAELWIIGQRHSQKEEAIEYENQLQLFAENNFRKGAVTWLGRRDDVPELMRNADLLIHAAKQEPLGRVLLESAASGLPIVTTNIGGTPEIMLGLEELMFDPNTFDDAVPTVINLLSDTARHQEVSGKLRQIAEQNFSAQRAGSDLVRCYLEATG